MLELLREATRRKLEKEAISLRQAEAYCGVSFSTLSRFLRGGDLTVANIEKLDSWITGKTAARIKQIGVKRISVGNKTFLVTIEQIKEEA